MTIEQNETDHEAPYATSPTDHVLTELQLHGYRPFQDDSEFWSANQAEHRFADGHELVAFDLPAANGYPATIGWELFGGLEYMTLVASGQAASLCEAKEACEAALVQALAALGHPPKA
jgi:hypothetical protein